MSFIAVCFCVTAVMLTGCGTKKEEPAAGKTAPGIPKVVKSAEQKEVAIPSMVPITEERTYYDFEGDLKGWEIPLWAQGKSDYVAKEIVISTDVASQGAESMKIGTDFPGGNWTAALVEVQQYLDLSQYRVISADLYLPLEAPEGLKVKVILTVGDNWKFVEMSRSVLLEPGKWVTISANIEPGSYDWKRVVPDENFAEDVRKVALRIESNRKPTYAGPIYIDNVRVGR